MRKRAGLCVGEKEMRAPTKNNIVLQDSKILLTVSPFYGVNPLVSTVLEMFSERKEMRE
jgi:hypothetical protein